jgi:hypothetical protein
LTAALRRSTLLKRVNQGAFEAVPAELMKWTKVDGRELPGLVRRIDQPWRIMSIGLGDWAQMKAEISPRFVRRDEDAGRHQNGGGQRKRHCQRDHEAEGSGEDRHGFGTVAAA